MQLLRTFVFQRTDMSLAKAAKPIPIGVNSFLHIFQGKIHTLLDEGSIHAHMRVGQERGQTSPSLFPAHSSTKLGLL
jgi:hypothetical protein